MTKTGPARHDKATAVMSDKLTQLPKLNMVEEKK